MDATVRTSRLWVVDAYNVMGARPDGWWRNRALALARLCDAIARWRPDQDEVLVMLDGHPKPEIPPGRHHGIEVRYARRGGPDGADRAIVEFLADLADLAGTTVVTSDADLRDRVRRLGAAVEGAGTFRQRLEAAGP